MHPWASYIIGKSIETALDKSHILLFGALCIHFGIESMLSQNRAPPANFWLLGVDVGCYGPVEMGCG